MCAPHTEPHSWALSRCGNEMATTSSSSSAFYSEPAAPLGNATETRAMSATEGYEDDDVGGPLPEASTPEAAGPSTSCSPKPLPRAEDSVEPEVLFVPLIREKRPPPLPRFACGVLAAELAPEASSLMVSQTSLDIRPGCVFEPVSSKLPPSLLPLSQ
mmetsp:Transcript_44464/g.88866  ORF Transcript_44464/g.88866 Transcript_44464/m.88866 type:complete len:158 (-) Transcript_44464:7-480(-)